MGLEKSDVSERLSLFTYTFLGTSRCLNREGNGNPLQYSCLGNPMDRGAWWAAVHGVAKSRIQLSDFTFMQWRRKWQPTPVFLPEESQGREPDGLPSVGLHRVGHDWCDVAAAAAAALTGKERTKTPEIFHTFVHLLCQAFTTERKTARRKRWSDRSEKQHGIAEIKHEFWETD